MLSLEQISTLINGLKTWVLNEIKKSKADLGPLADEFVSFKEQVQDTIDNAALKPMVVMAKDGILEANYNSSEIYNYVTSGGTAVFKYESEILPLIDFDETFSTFLFTINNGNFISTRAFIVYEDGRIETEDEFSNTVRIVNLSGDGTTPSLGPADIIDIANSGRLVLLEYNGDYYNLADKSSEDNPYPMVTFQKWLYYESELRIVSIDIDYNYEVNIDFHDPLNIGVSSVNGQSGYVELTAEDVGALSLDTLQNGIDTALNQAKESGDFNGPQGIPGKDNLPNVLEIEENAPILVLEHNTEYHCTNPLTSLTIEDFTPAAGGKVSTWAIQFVAGENFVLTMPEKMKWAIADPVFVTGVNYWFSFVPLVNGKVLGVWVSDE